MNASKTYLGDGVYVSLDMETASLVLTTEEGVRTTNRIVLEPEVLTAFFDYLHQMREAVEAGGNGKQAH